MLLIMARDLPGKQIRSDEAFASASTTASAAAVSGTRCSRLPFIRSAGTVHTFDLRFISSQRAPITSPVRAAVRIVNSSALAAMPGRARSSAMNVAIST